MISFFIDPAKAREAVLSGRKLLVEIGPNFRRVTVWDAPEKPKASARARCESNRRGQR